MESCRLDVRLRAVGLPSARYLAGQCAGLGQAILDADLREDLSWLRDLRVKADYWEDQVSYEEASEAASIAQQFVALLEVVDQ